MDLLLVVAVIAGLALCFKVGMNAGREEILTLQAGAISLALADSHSAFFGTMGLHGSYAPPGHENRLPMDWVVVSRSELRQR